VLAVVLILFGGGGKLSRLMGDFGKGLKSFKKGVKEEDVEQISSETISADAGVASSLEKDQAANG
jgi:sec-independent protein translocase protein TatA